MDVRKLIDKSPMKEKDYLSILDDFREHSIDNIDYFMHVISDDMDKHPKKSKRNKEFVEIIAY